MSLVSFLDAILRIYLIMSVKSALITFAIATTGSLLLPFTHQVEGKGSSSGGGSRPGSRPSYANPSYRPTSGSSSKSFGAKKVAAFAAGAYVGGKVATKVGKYSFLL